MSSYPAPRKTLRVGDSGSFTKVISEKDIFRFADASGDYNPLHIDETYARNTRFGKRVAHGILTAGIISNVLGSDIPGIGTIFLQLQIRFYKPVYINDRITATAMVEEIIQPDRVRMLVSCTNQNGEDVAIGNAIVIPPKETEVIGVPTGRPEND
ncbi:MAG: MaoC family dehydratase [Phycisphaerales bacterium]|nr:MaoC family dehydratase [Phycisphaerales bacterium]